YRSPYPTHCCLSSPLIETFLFFFKQKTAYEIETDWSSDVCSSDLLLRIDVQGHHLLVLGQQRGDGQPDVATSGNGDLHSSDSQRSEERRVGKECRYRRRSCHATKKREQHKRSVTITETSSP